MKQSVNQLVISDLHKVYFADLATALIYDYTFVLMPEAWSLKHDWWLWFLTVPADWAECERTLKLKWKSEIWKRALYFGFCSGLCFFLFAEKRKLLICASDFEEMSTGKSFDVGFYEFFAVTPNFVLVYSGPALRSRIDLRLPCGLLRVATDLLY
jgi:hypothetical protein